MDGSPQQFYDDLAEEYHLLFADWRASIDRQSAALDRLIREAAGPGSQRVLDCACGIGTQAIGLAQRGHQVHASDLSPAAVARARREAARVGVTIAFDVADMRELGQVGSGAFDVVLACDNALPHLLDEADLHRAVAGMAARLRPGGLFLASLRDYDALARERPASEGPRILPGPDGRRITFQVWDWAEDGSRYVVHQVILRETRGTWQTRHFVTTYRALQRAILETALENAGLTGVTWHEPDDTGFFQPIVTARAGA